MLSNVLLLILQICLGLRPGELLAIRQEDIVPGRKDLHNGNAVVALGKRHGTKAGRPQFVVVHANKNHIAMSLVAAFASTMPPGSLLSSGLQPVFQVPRERGAAAWAGDHGLYPA